MNFVKICPVCQKIFNAPSDATKYCSQQCSGKANGGRARQYPPITRTCIECGKKIQIKYQNVNAPKRFCSRKCYSDFLKSCIEKRLEEIGGDNICQNNHET